MRISEIINEEALFEAHIPPTSYGYWLTPEGEFLPVGYQAHTTALRTLIGFGSTMMDAYRLNWVRIGSNVKEAPDILFVNFMVGSLTSRSMSAIRQLAASQDFNKYYMTALVTPFEKTEMDFDGDKIGRRKFLSSVMEYGTLSPDQLAA